MDSLSKIRKMLIIGTAALSLPLVAVASSAGASTPHPKFINALHAWAPATRQHTNSFEVKLGVAICTNLGVLNQEGGYNQGGHPYGYLVISEEWGELVRGNKQLVSPTSPQAGYALINDILGVSVLELCPVYEPGIQYENQSNVLPAEGALPTTSKPPKAVLRAGNEDGYAYSAPWLDAPPGGINKAWAWDSEHAPDLSNRGEAGVVSLSSTACADLNSNTPGVVGESLVAGDSLVADDYGVSDSDATAILLGATYICPQYQSAVLAWYDSASGNTGDPLTGTGNTGTAPTTPTTAPSGPVVGTLCDNGTGRYTEDINTGSVICLT